MAEERRCGDSQIIVRNEMSRALAMNEAADRIDLPDYLDQGTRAQMQLV
jgi:hypothetical protein